VKLWGALGVVVAAGGCQGGPLGARLPGGQAPAGATGQSTPATDGGVGGRTGAADAAAGGVVADAGSPIAPESACTPPSSSGPRLLSPQSGSVVTSTRPVFRWTGVAGPYLFRVCADRACQTMIQGTSTADSQVTLPLELAPGYWFWQVKAAGPSPSGWTSAWEFRVRRRFPGYAPAANTSVGGFSDYNGDGYPDLAAWGTAPMAYLGGPDGISAGRVWPPDPNGGLATGLLEPQVDVNGDGFTDLSFSSGEHVANVQCGGSDGFDSVVDVPSGGAYSSPIGVGDFFGDGFGDLIMQSRYSAAFIRVFAAAAPSPTLAGLGCGNCQIQQVATGDFDGDGRTDLIFADATEVSLYMGNPNGPAAAAVRGASGLAVVDFNYDGYSDLVSPDWTTQTLLAYEGGPAGLSPTPSTAAQPTPFLVVGDFDGDGYWDTIGQTSCPNGCTVSYGGPGGWGAPPTRTTPVDASIVVYGGYPPAARVVDLNADGYDDLVVPGPGSSALSWYAGSPGGLASTPTKVLTSPSD